MTFSPDEEEKLMLEIKEISVEFIRKLTNKCNEEKIFFFPVLEHSLELLLRSHISAFSKKQGISELQLFARISENIIEELK